MKDSTSRISRRGLIKSTAAFSTAFVFPELVPRHCVTGSGLRPPSETVNVAGIGVGGMGGNDIRASQYAGARIAALCDVDTGNKRAPERHGAAADSILVRSIGDEDFPDAARYRDFRVLLEKEKNIDAVIVGTPDHTHAAIAMAAIQLGKNVYCEKPLARTVYEVRRIDEPRTDTLHRNHHHWRSTSCGREQKHGFFWPLQPRRHMARNRRPSMP